MRNAHQRGNTHSETHAIASQRSPRPFETSQTVASNNPGTPTHTQKRHNQLILAMSNTMVRSRDGDASIVVSRVLLSNHSFDNTDTQSQALRSQSPSLPLSRSLSLSLSCSLAHSPPTSPLVFFTTVTAARRHVPVCHYGHDDADSCTCCTSLNGSICAHFRHANK